jgi:SMP-30/Gluconolactonase/LRE-like region
VNAWIRLFAIGGVLAALTLPVASAEASPCSPWQGRTLLSGQGWLENLTFDGRGGMTLSALTQGKLLRLLPSGSVSTLLSPVFAPGGQRRRGNALYFNTGDTVSPAATGTVDRLDLTTGMRSTWTNGLTMPNGLIFLHGGDAVVSGNVPPEIGLTRIPARNPSEPQVGWAKLGDTNGMALDPSGRWLYVDRDPPLVADGEVDRVLISDPGIVQVVGRLGTGTLPDDMTIDKQGVLYIAAFLAGKIYRLDPRTHSVCAIASNFAGPTAVKFGGPGWHAHDLYATDATGHVTELTPPGHG